MPINDKIKSLYDALKADGGDVWDHVQPEFKTIVTVLEGEGEPTVHKPSTAVSSPTIGTDDAITIEYSNIAPDTRLTVFKYADRLPINKNYIVEGRERFNSGSFELSSFEPGEYHVRGIDPNGNIIANSAISRSAIPTASMTRFQTLSARSGAILSLRLAMQV